MEDLNFLYYRQQLALSMVETSNDPIIRREHELLARLYHDRIRRARLAARKGDLRG